MTWKLPPTDTYFGPALAKTPEGFELDHLEFALQYCQRFRFAIDGGAHVGTWSVALAKRFKQVVAFEPAADTYACLVENTAAYPNIRTVRAALGSIDGVCFVHDDATRKGNTGSRMVVEDPTGTVPLVRLDSVKFDEVDFLKLDLEGYEGEALKGAKQLLFDCAPVVMVECKQFSPPRHGGPEQTVQLLANFGYSEVGGIRNDRVFLLEGR